MNVVITSLKHIGFQRLHPDEKSSFGPSTNRSKTDVYCLYIFAAFLFTWIVIGLYVTASGDINRLVKISDSSDRKCGIDSGVLDRPYVSFVGSAECDSQHSFDSCRMSTTCVKHCPSSSFYYDETKCTARMFNEFRDQLICKAHVNTFKIRTCEEITTLVKNKDCSAWYFDSTPVARFCMPSLHSNPTTKTKLADNVVADFKRKIEAELRQDDEVFSWIKDFLKTKWYIFIALIFATICSLSFIVMMRWLAKPIIWFSIFMVEALIFAVMCMCFTLYNQGSVESNEEHKQFADICFFAGIAALITLVIVALVFYYLWERITLGIALVEETSKAVDSITSTVFFPLVPWLFQILITLFATCVGVLLLTNGTPIYEVRGLDYKCKCDGPAANYWDGGSCIPEVFEQFCKEPMTGETCESAKCSFEGLKNQTLNHYFHAVNVFGFVWSSCFISAFTEMVLAMTFATWYWTFNKSNIPFFALTNGADITARFHLGTLAFGSFLVALCKVIRDMIKCVKRRIRAGLCLSCFCLCCVKCPAPKMSYVEKFLELVNRNAYIMVAIHGKSYRESAQSAVELVARNILRFAALNGVANWLFFIAKLLLTCGVGGLAYNFFNQEYFHSQIRDIEVPVFIVMVGTFLIANVFFSVYSMAVDTIFLCFLEDTERNDGSDEHPYFMPKKLMKIFGKKNVTPSDDLHSEV